MQSHTIERLEVEDEDERVRRFHNTFQKLNTSTSASSFSSKPELKLDFEEKKPHPVGPSPLLSRVQAFLPQMEASNAELTQRMETDPSSVDIENITEGVNQYIEMNLGLGVFTTKPSQQDTEMSPTTSESSDSTTSNSAEDEDDSDYDSDSSDESGIISLSLPPHLNASAKARMIKPLPRRSLSDRLQQQQRDRVKPHIVMLKSGSQADLNLEVTATSGLAMEPPTSVLV
ncbi:hypothetical protein E1B28_007853 [Marasmius oreades]|uniref:Uncharacterized protein n=1 Tax=Marasmius oreades TaxID=181124 RepID=A0A9P7UU72_9AGAR|nr:uncharacterized protein E1B28_007853 [Marasmius oreades]KAG7094248.1 hypothetical protein E1B28_007853 [Marasmius oreades]